MTRTFKGWRCRVIEFLESPEGGVDCIWFRTTRSLLHIRPHPPNSQRAQTWPGLARWAYKSNEGWAALEAWDRRLQWGFAGETPAPLMP